MRRNLLLLLILCAFLPCIHAQGTWHVVRSNQQKHFAKTIPVGNYSGIAHVDDDVYAMVSDKSDSALYFNVRLYLSKQTGEILQAEYLGPEGHVDVACADNEAIARVTDSTIVVASEGHCRLKEFGLGNRSEREGLWEWHMPASEFYDNYNFESVTYDSLRQCLWAIPESTMRRDGKAASPSDAHRNVLRMLAFDWKKRSTTPTAYLYRTDMPTTMRTAQTYVFGVSELCVLPDGQLLVLEREAFVPKAKIGAFCQCKLYVVNPSHAVPYDFDKGIEPDAPYMEKHLLTSWNTKLGLLNQTWANYEGMCLGPKLDDGSQVIVLVSDSQDGYAGVLRDWFKTIVISK